MTSACMFHQLFWDCVPAVEATMTSKFKQLYDNLHWSIEAEENCEASRYITLDLSLALFGALDIFSNPL